MLLFLLTFYLHYNLLNGEEINTTNFNESLLLDNHRQNILQAKTVLKDLEQKLKANPVANENDTRRDDLPGDRILDDQFIRDLTKNPAEVLPSPHYNPFDPHLDDPPISPGSNTSVICPDHTALVPLKDLRPGPPYSGLLSRSMQSLYPGLTPLSLLSIIGPGRYNASFSDTTSSTLATSTRQQVFLKGPPSVLPMYPELMPPKLLSVNGPGRYVARFSDSPNSTSSTIKIQEVFNEKPPSKDPILHLNLHELKYIRPTVSTPSVLRSKAPRRFATPETFRAPTTLDKNAILWLKQIAPYTRLHKKLKKATQDGVPHRSGRPTVPGLPRTVQGRNIFSYFGTANTEPLFIEDEHGFLKVTIPKIIPEKLLEEWRTTKAGDVLFGKSTVQPPTIESSRQRYYDMMKILNEGALMVFVIEICRLVAVKDKHHVRKFLGHAELKYNELWESRRLMWLHEPLQTVVKRLLQMPPTDHDVQVIQVYSSMMFHMLLNRRQSLSPEVNTIIDLISGFYKNRNILPLLGALHEFEQHPNTSTSSFSITDSLIETFLRPLHPSRFRNKLVDNINQALKRRFPLLLRKQHHNVEGNPKIANQPTKRRKKKHHYKKRKRKIQTENIYMRQHNQDLDYKDPIETSSRTVTTKRYRKKNGRLTTAVVLLDHELHGQDTRDLRLRLRRRQMKEVDRACEFLSF